MSTNFEFLKDYDVISLSESEGDLFSLSKTYKVSEISQAISDALFKTWNNPERQILDEGIEYEVLRVDQKSGWRKGKLRLEFVFYPDHSDQDQELENLRHISA